MIHVMKWHAGEDGAPPLPLRARQQRETRGRILDAFLELSHESNAINISVPDVAEASGVSVRTIYRYFATKDELQTAAASHMSSQILGRRELGEVDAASVHDYLTELWRGLGQAMPAVLAEHTSPAGRAIRRVRLDAARAAAARSLPPDVPPETVDLIVAVTSSSMLMELVDRMGYSPDEAATIAADLAVLIANDAHQRDVTKENDDD